MNTNVLGHFFGICRSIFAFGSDFLEHLRSKLHSEAIFSIVHQFFMDFARIFGEFSDDFSMILQIFFENADLHNSRAHAVFRTCCATWLFVCYKSAASAARPFQYQSEGVATERIIS